MQHQNKKLTDFSKLLRLYAGGAVFTALDTEATCCDPTTGKLLEIGAVKFNKDSVISEYQTLINPEQPIPEFIQQLTSINDLMVKDSPKINTVLPQFIDFIQDSILIAHNAQSDINYLYRECENCSINFPHNKFIDTLQFSRWAYPENGQYKLETLASQFDINPGHSHRAFDDAVTCMELFKRILIDTKLRQKGVKL